MDLPLLSLFPGADLLGRGFEAAGFCVVRGPDLITGGDIRDFRPTFGAFRGVFGGSPCQDFSSGRRSAPTGYGLEMLREFGRCAVEAWPDWFLLENVTGVPDLRLNGFLQPQLTAGRACGSYNWQRFNLTARECGGRQHRIRCFQFAWRDNLGPIVIDRPSIGRGGEPACMAVESKQPGRRGFADFCELQGLPRTFDLPGWSLAAKYRAVGNGVPVYMARTIAEAIKARTGSHADLCACGCGRPVRSGCATAGPACRKRMERERKKARGL